MQQPSIFGINTTEGLPTDGSTRTSGIYTSSIRRSPGYFERVVPDLGSVLGISSQSIRCIFFFIHTLDRSLLAMRDINFKNRGLLHTAYIFEINLENISRIQLQATIEINLEDGSRTLLKNVFEINFNRTCAAYHPRLVKDDESESVFIRDKYDTALVLLSLPTQGLGGAYI